MKPTTTDVTGCPPGKTQSLSRFHPRASGQPDGEQGSPPDGDLKSKEGSWVQTPSGFRPPPSSSRSAEFPAFPKIDVPRRESASPDSEPSAETLLSNTRSAPRIPAWLLKETALAFKAGLVVLFLVAAIIAFKSGEYRGRIVALGEVKPAPAPAPALPPADFPEELLPALDTALRLLREGENLEALESLNKMLASHPKVPSLHYATAIAALQAGYPREAGRLADASIKGGFRVSDSWALKAAIAASQTKGPSAEQETLLKKAIASDPMNPSPFIELASLLRYQGKSGPAAGLLESAAFRLNPADAQTVVETTKAVLALDVAGNLAPLCEPLGIPAKDIPNAYSEMKRGNFENAATILRFCRNQTAPDLFDYLVNDPSLRKFTSRPELKEFH
ncbi:MAG: tetratricopeptide repeat protein [Terrimicrobiaceae bacterium]